MNLPLTICPGFTKLTDAPLLAKLARSSLMAQGIHFQLIGKGFFTGQNLLPMEIAVHQRNGSGIPVEGIN